MAGGRLVLSSRHRVFVDWCRATGTSPKDVVEVTGPSDLWGRPTPDLIVVLYGADPRLVHEVRERFGYGVPLEYQTHLPSARKMGPPW